MKQNTMQLTVVMSATLAGSPGTTLKYDETKDNAT